MRTIPKVIFTSALGLLLASGLRSQIVPQSAHVNLYFPQLADGGPRAQQWQTIFSFNNPNLSKSAAVLLEILGNHGRPMALDLGSGLASRHSFVIPPLGLRVLRSRIASSSIVTGWAVAFASLPVQATVAFRQLENGVPKTEITAEPTLPSVRYDSIANAFLGVAIANVYSDAPVAVTLTVRDSEGSVVGQQTVTVPILGHVAFPLGERFPNLGTGFTGTLQLTTGGMDEFVAWTLNGDSAGILSSLPPGRLGWPISHWDRIWLTFRTTLEAARPYIGPQPVELRISAERVINAFAAGGNLVQINLAYSQLIADSPSELAFVVAHELGHIYQQRTGRLEFNLNRELDADIWGMLLSLLAGYDPYAAAGALGKLEMALGRAGLTSQIFHELLAADAHRSMPTRIDNVYQSIVTLCSLPDVRSFCAQYRSLFHPNFPPSVPLAQMPTPERYRPSVE